MSRVKNGKRKHDWFLTHTNHRLRVPRAGATVQGWIDNAKSMAALQNLNRD